MSHHSLPLDNQHHNALITKMHLENFGENLLISDFLENYDEVNNAFYSNNKINSKSLSNSIILPGFYNSYIKQKKYEKSGLRVKEVLLCHSDYEVLTHSDEWELVFDLDINCGSCLFLTDTVLEHKLDLDIFLEKLMSCQYTGNMLPFIVNGKLLGFGVSSGFGDGRYDFFALYEEDRIIALKVEFISDEEDEEELFHSVFLDEASYTSDDDSSTDNSTFDTDNSTEYYSE